MLSAISKPMSTAVRIGAQFYSTSTKYAHLSARKQSLIPTAGTYPSGFRATGIHCGVKKKAGVKDLALIVSEYPCTAAAVFTTNVFKAAPVIVSREILDKNRGQGIYGVVTNSGCANAVTGTVGLENARRMSQTVDTLTGQPNSSVVMSTGVIGQHLPIAKIEKGVQDAAASLASDHDAWSRAAEAFMTTDTFPKLCSATFTLPSGTSFRMAGITKGAGMIHPNMATLLGFIVTDARIDATLLNKALKHAVDRSFNAISVDGDMSTNDTIAVLANGAAVTDGKGIVNEQSEDFKSFRDRLADFAANLAQLVVRDGEGATKFVTVNVQGANTFEEAKQVASTIATSSLVKTALYGQDANWGRILCAVGYSGVSSIDPTRVSVSFVPTDGSTSLPLLVKGEPENVDEARASEILKMEDLEIRVELGLGKEEAKMWTCDLSHEYISINADYRS
ncbi:ArgJ family protein [Jimgerdemannia flammicorona]|uniref:Arginine biosynthesis bifunctional protein ArgJ, mitochondrial n=1 Tax=Jimgerdemannia flammicorona TaxID=994334 RepID=A0A433QQX3_9FUNG|nr:ArgJ family protein [Jimgerdemannia flammicorona]